MQQERESGNSNLEGYLKAIDVHDDELASLRGSYMQQCKGPRAGIREIMGELRESGENMKAFRVLLKGHREERKQQKRIAALEEEDALSYEDMLARLGDLAGTPLGIAALDRGNGRRNRDERDDLNA